MAKPKIEHCLDIIFLGRPGAGKRTQAELLAKAIRMPMYTTGEMCRRLASECPALASPISEYVSAGKLLPDAIIAKCFLDALAKSGSKRGIIYVGFCRTREQAIAVHQTLLMLGRRYIVINLAAGQKEAENRLRTRANGATDEQQLALCLAEFQEHFGRVAELFKRPGMWQHVGAEQTIETVTKEVWALEPIKPLLQ